MTSNWAQTHPPELGDTDWKERTSFFTLVLKFRNNTHLVLCSKANFNSHNWYVMGRCSKFCVKNLARTELVVLLRYLEEEGESACLFSGFSVGQSGSPLVLCDDIVPGSMPSGGWHFLASVCWTSAPPPDFLNLSMSPFHLGNKY